MKKIILSVTAFCCIQVLNAQLKVAVSYPISFSSGDLNEFIGETSFRGIGMEFYKMVKPNLGIGVETGWSVFYEKVAEKTYTEGTASLTGTQYRYANVVPILATGKFFKTGSGRATPYAGLGIGTLYVNRYTDLGLYRFTNETWQFCLRPEIGVAINTASGAPGVIVAAKYFSGFSNDDLDGQSYIGLHIGILFN